MYIPRYVLYAVLMDDPYSTVRLRRSTARRLQVERARLNAIPGAPWLKSAEELIIKLLDDVAKSEGKN